MAVSFEDDDDDDDGDDDNDDDDDADNLLRSVYRQQVIWQILPLDGAVDSHLPRYWKIKIQKTLFSHHKQTGGKNVTFVTSTEKFLT